MRHGIKFRHLEAFVTIARARSFKRAAEQLNLTQPAISKTLKDLEDMLGTKLMERGRAGVRLTPEGEVFLQFADQSTAALRLGLSNLRTLRSGGAAALTVGALPSVAAELLPAAATLFREAMPQTILRVEEGPHGYLTDGLRAGDFDLVVGRMGKPETMAGLSFTQLYSERVVIAVAPDHPLVGAQSLQELTDYPVLYPPKDAAIRPLVARLLIANGIALFENRIESASGAFGRALTLGPLRAVWFISQGVVADELAAGRLVALDIDTGPTSGPVGIMARSEEDPAPAARLFRQSLREAAASLR